MKNLTLKMATLIFLINSAGAQAASYNGRIQTLYVDVSQVVLVLENDSGHSVGNNCGSAFYNLKPTNIFFNELYAMFLTAAKQGEKVKVNYSACEGSRAIITQASTWNWGD